MTPTAVEAVREAQTLEAGEPCAVRLRAAVETRRRCVQPWRELCGGPGAWSGAPDPEYRKWPGLSQSALKSIDQHGEVVRSAETQAMRDGTAYHDDVLLGEPAVGVAAAWAAATKAALDREFPGWRRGEKELSLAWWDCDQRLKARVDLLDWKSRTAIDLKTTIRPAHEFSKIRAWFGYDVQAVHYLSGLRATGVIGGGWRWAWIVQPKTGEPPVVAHWTPTLEAHRKWRQMLATARAAGRVQKFGPLGAAEIERNVARYGARAETKL